MGTRHISTSCPLLSQLQFHSTCRRLRDFSGYCRRKSAELSKMAMAITFSGSLLAVPGSWAPSSYPWAISRNLTIIKKGEPPTFGQLKSALRPKLGGRVETMVQRASMNGGLDMTSHCSRPNIVHSKQRWRKARSSCSAPPVFVYKVSVL